ncbi:MAG: alpha/beta hydrolase [Bryobacterales bacterium]|nr:alpha/beta hydrolase [Bryobacterales bacterium]
MRLLLFFWSSLLGDVTDLSSESVLFAQPGRMIGIGRGSRLSMYCIGSGSPTVVLESGFGGGTPATWRKLQVRLGEVTRTCSYDRAGYGFSTLGQNLPRDLNHMVTDLTELLARSGEPAPYVLAGHSNGGFIISAYTRQHPGRVAGLVFLDAALALPGDAENARAGRAEGVSAGLRKHLDAITSCLNRAEMGLVPAAGDACVDPTWYSSFPPALAQAEIANRRKPDFWRAYLSEAENNYGGVISRQAWKLLPHRWERLPVRVFVASVSSMADGEAARALGVEPDDTVGLAQARANRAKWEKRQESICRLASDCEVVRVPTADHLVHNAAPEQVTATIARLVSRMRKSR